MFYEETYDPPELNSEPCRTIKIHTDDQSEDIKHSFFTHYSNFKNFFKKVFVYQFYTVCSILSENGLTT